MPKIKEETGTTTTQVKVGINPNKTNLLGATRIKGIKTPREAITTGVKGEITILFEPPSYSVPKAEPRCKPCSEMNCNYVL